MKIEWTEKHSMEVSEESLKYIAKRMDAYAIPYGWNLAEHCLDEWVSDPEEHINTSSYIENWDELVANFTEVVKRYKDEN